jgi:hypothetical protein
VGIFTVSFNVGFWGGAFLGGAPGALAGGVAGGGTALYLTHKHKVGPRVVEAVRSAVCRI